MMETGIQPSLFPKLHVCMGLHLHREDMVRELALARGYSQHGKDVL
jgi:hypothetical protein